MAQSAQFSRAGADPFAAFHRDTQKLQVGFGLFAAMILLLAVVTACYAIGWKY